MMRKVNRVTKGSLTLERILIEAVCAKCDTATMMRCVIEVIDLRDRLREQIRVIDEFIRIAKTRGAIRKSKRRRLRKN